MTLKTQKAVGAETCGKLWRVNARNGKGNGLKANCKACTGRLDQDMMAKPCSITRLGLGGLKFCRRTIAAPLRGVFLWSIVPTHGVIASAFRTGAPRGNPSGLLFPVEQSANPRGAAHLLAGVIGSQNLSTGA